MSRIGFVVHAGRDEALSVARDLITALTEAGVETRAVPGEDVGASESVAAEAFPVDVDLVVAVGGDGTFLRAAQVAHPGACPVLGVKVGRLGFLTEVEPRDALALIKRALDGELPIEDRLSIVAEPESAAWSAPLWALNEVIVEKHSRHRLIKLAVSVDDHLVTTFSADGVIVATPTGSTAYSFSARGPIVSPTLGAIVVTPVAAHMVFDRSIVLSADRRVTLRAVGDEPGVVSADGREGVELPVGAAVHISAASQPSRFLRNPDSPSFFELVRAKFGLPG